MSQETRTIGESRAGSAALPAAALPRISVIVPTYNRAAALPTCIEAILAQDFPPCEYELIVMDDGSPGKANADVVAQYAEAASDVRYVHQQNRGPAAARNHGATIARGEILVFTDDDCVPDRNWLHEMTQPFQDPQVNGVKGAYKTRQKSVVALFAQAEFETRYQKLLKSNRIDFVDSYSAAFRRQVFLGLGGFDTSFPKANNEDVEFSYRMEAHGHYMVFNPRAVVYHSHPATLFSYLMTKFGRAYWRMVVYRLFPHKMMADAYTPQTLKIQILLVGSFLAAGALALVRRTGLDWVMPALGALFLLTTLPFLLQIINLPLINRMTSACVRWARRMSFRRLLRAVAAALWNGMPGRIARGAWGMLCRCLSSVLRKARAIVRSSLVVGIFRALRMLSVGAGRWVRQAAVAAWWTVLLPPRAAAASLRFLGRVAVRIYNGKVCVLVRNALGSVVRTRVIMALLAPLFLLLRAFVMGLGVFWGVVSQHGRSSRFSHFVALVMADTLALASGYGAACAVRYWTFGTLSAPYCPAEAYLYIGPVLIALLLVSFFLGGLYRSSDGLGRINELVMLVKATFSVGVIVMVAMYLFRYPYSRILVVLTFCSSIALVPAGRGLVRRALARQQNGGAPSGKKMIIVGLGEMAHFVFHKLKHTRLYLGTEIVGFVAPSGTAGGGTFCGLDIVGSVEQLDRLIAELEVSDVVVAMPQAAQSELMNIVETGSRRAGVHCHVISNIFDLVTAETDMAAMNNIPIAYFRNENMALLNVLLKRGFDVAFSLLVVLLSFPLWIVIMLAIRLENEGAAIFRQDRVGRDGKLFRVFKFRTMHASAPAFEYAPESPHDARISRVGRFLRRTSLDELPQFINVLKGEMSVVGPRPEMPFIVAKYTDWERQRLKVKPGLTGLWQIMGRKDLPLHESIEYDFYYIKNQSLLLDLVIILRTVAVVLSRKGAY